MSQDDDTASSRSRRLTREQINELVYENPDVQADWARDPHVIRSRELYARSAVGLLADLAEAGFVVDSVGELKRKHPAYKAVVPVLLKWLPSARYLPLAEDIVRALSANFAKSEVAPIFISMFRDPPEVDDPMRPEGAPKSPKEHLRWVIGNGLGIHASPAISDQLIEFAQDRSYGEARTEIVLSLPKTKDDRVPAVLIELLDDPTVAPFAIEALGKMRCDPAASRIESMLDSPNKNVRDQAKKALRRING